MRLRRQLIAAIAALLVAACSSETEPEWPAPSPAIWEVRGPDGTATGWLAGTMHSFPADFDWECAAWRDAFAASDLLVLEIADYDTPGRSAEAFWRAAHSDIALAPASARIGNDEAAAARLGQLLGRQDIADAATRALDTWALAVIAGQAADRGKRFPGADSQLFDRADARRGYEVLALESATAQFALFDSLPQAEQVDLLELTLAEAGDDGRGDDNARAWLTGDTYTLERALFETILSDPQLREALLIDRNRAWAARIDALLDAGDRPFVAVGTAHLLGKDSVVALLQDAGWQVRRLP